MEQLDAVEAMLVEHAEIERDLSDPAVHADPARARRLGRRYAELGRVVQAYRQWRAAAEDAQAAAELAAEDEAFAVEVPALQEAAATAAARLHRVLVPRDPDDARDVILEIKAGEGGEESALFAGDLLRMYTRYAERQGWRTEIVSESEGEVGGYKEVVIRVVGDGAYGKLKFESGGHRVQRVPATETQGRIHTSACTVAALPEPDEATAVQINPADLRIDTYRASGAGGQHVNKTDSAVRITHIPTGIAVACQAERSQHKNRAKAWEMLRSRLYEEELKRREAAASATEAAKTEIGWGHQIRSYVLDASRIKDLRTGVERSDCDKVLDGDIDEYLEASLKQGL